jgi:hypothetical protein
MNRDVDLLDEKRDSIYQMWVKCENLNDIYENHHSREWLDNHCMVRDLSEMIPDDIDVVLSCSKISIVHTTTRIQENVLRLVKRGITRHGSVKGVMVGMVRSKA